MFTPYYQIAKIMRGHPSNDASARMLLQKLTKVARQAWHCVNKFYNSNKRMTKKETKKFTDLYYKFEKEWDALPKGSKTEKLEHNFGAELYALSDFIQEAGYRKKKGKKRI